MEEGRSDETQVDFGYRRGGDRRFHSLAQFLEPRHTRCIALDRRAARTVMARPTSRATPPAHNYAAVELKHARAPLALRTLEDAPAAAVRKLAVCDGGVPAFLNRPPVIRNFLSFRCRTRRASTPHSSPR
jgi:hypothetical protein